MGEYYILGGEDGRTPVEVADIAEWSRVCNNNWRVAVDMLPGDVRISTVFLGLNHNFGRGAPLLFETMIFGGPHDDYQERCSTWAEAEEQHAKALALAKGEVK